MEDKYTFETTDKREMDLVVNRNRMLLALSELRDWRNSLYRGKDYDGCYLVCGKLYSERELMEATDLPRNEYGYLEDCKKVYSADDIITKIDYILDNMDDFIERNLY